MISQQLIDYIKQRLSQGATKEEIKSSLLANGWIMPDIEEGFRAVDSPLPIQPNPAVQPNPPVVQTPQSLPTSSAPISKFPNKIPLIILSAVGLLTIGGAAFAYYYFQTPEMVVKRMMKAWEKADSFGYQGELDIEMSDIGGNSFDLLGRQGQLTINFKGVDDESDVNNPKWSLYFDMTAIDGTSLGAEIKYIDKIVYFKLNDKFFGLSPATNQWIKLDVKKLGNLLGPEESAGDFLNWELSPEQIEKINKIQQKSKFLKLTEKLPSEKIEGTNTTHYKFKIDKDELKKSLMDIAVVIDNKSLMEKEIEEFEEIEFIDGEIWIGKKDLLPRKIVLNLKTEITNSLVSFDMAISVKILFRDYNKPAQIETPFPTQNFEEVFAPLLMKILEGASGETQ